MSFGSRLNSLSLTFWIGGSIDKVSVVLLSRTYNSSSSNLTSFFCARVCRRVSKANAPMSFIRISMWLGAVCCQWVKWVAILNVSHGSMGRRMLTHEWSITVSALKRCIYFVCDDLSLFSWQKRQFGTRHIVTSLQHRRTHQRTARIHSWNCKRFINITWGLQ